jgi:hypothetical protein
MSKFVEYEVIASRADGTKAKFMIHDQDNTPRPVRGYTHDEALQAETQLYNRLVQVFQGEDE